MKKKSKDESYQVLGVESSCDDTAASVVKITNCTDNKKIEVLSSIVLNQNSLHSEFKGIVPEIAARAHSERIDICTKEALKKANIKKGKRLRKLRLWDERDSVGDDKKTNIGEPDSAVYERITAGSSVRFFGKDHRVYGWLRSKVRVCRHTQQSRDKGHAALLRGMANFPATLG